ncbi:hypothetical protein C2S51_001574 [Perilla frutescens var. frutescens]|nr:hypothetical protein C2S51_001574 [Perilla frutescens var. frutescens]
MCLLYDDGIDILKYNIVVDKEKIEKDTGGSNKPDKHDIPYGRGKNKHFWTEEESWALIRCLQGMTVDPLWKTDGGFKNNYMNEIRKIMMQKLPTFTKEIIRYNVSVHDMTNGVRFTKKLRKAKVKHVPNVESEFKALSDQVVGFMNSVSSYFESMSAFVQGKSSKMPEVLHELGKHGFTGKDSVKAAQAICEDAVKVELLFSLDPSEVQDYVLSFL